MFDRCGILVDKTKILMYSGNSRSGVASQLTTQIVAATRKAAPCLRACAPCFQGRTRDIFSKQVQGLNYSTCVSFVGVTVGTCTGLEVDPSLAHMVFLTTPLILRRPGALQLLAHRCDPKTQVPAPGRCVWCMTP
jgi:hypothetical protein